MSSTFTRLEQAQAQGWPGAADYAASKAFVMILGESLHVELGKRGVTGHSTGIVL